MSTVIKCKVDGIDNLFELQGGLSFGYDSSANVGNTTKKITFGPINVSPFSFSITQPEDADAKELITWLVTHKIKSKVTFQVSDTEMEASTRDLELENVCLESYNETISEFGREISLAMVGQIVTVDGVPVDQSEQR